MYIIHLHNGYFQKYFERISHGAKLHCGVIIKLYSTDQLYKVYKTQLNQRFGDKI